MYMDISRTIQFPTMFSILFILTLPGAPNVFADDIRHNSTFNPGIAGKKQRYTSEKHGFHNHRDKRIHRLNRNHHLHKHRIPRRNSTFQSRHRFNHPIHRAFELRNGISTQLHPVSPTIPRGKFMPHHRHRFHR